MFARFVLAIIGLCFSFQSYAQTLTISSGTQTASSGTTWVLSNNVLTVYGNSTINASTIVAGLSTSSLSIVGSTSNLAVNVNQALTSSPVGSNLTIGASDNNGNITISQAISVGGALTVFGADIALAANLSTTGSGKDIKLLARNQIDNTAAVVCTTNGGNLVLSADADASNAGNIYLVYTFSANTYGGDITFGGGNASASGFACGYGTEFEEGIDIRGVFNIQSGGGDIVFRGKSDVGAASGNGIYGVGFWDHTTNKTINAETGTIYIEGYSYGSNTTTNEYNYGVAIDGATVTITSANSSTNAIVIKGSNYSGGPTGSTTIDGRGIDIRATNTKIHATVGGSISMEAQGYYGFTLYENIEILASTGTISLVNLSDGDADDFYVNCNLWLGSRASTFVATSSANIIWKGDDFTFANGHTPDIATTGIFQLEPVATSTSFDEAISNAWFTWNQNSQTLSSLILGKAGSAADISFDVAQTVAGPITIYGRDIDVNQNLTASLSGAAILLQATSAINVAASKSIQTNAGDVTLNACSGGVATSASSAIYLYSGSQILTGGGDITLGGAYPGSDGNLYAATNISGGGYAVRLLSATLSAAGGDIRIYGRNVTSYGDGVFLSAVTINTTGAGTIGISGDSFGGHTPATTNTPLTYFGGITFNANASLIQTVNGNLTLKGILTQSQSTSGYGINFYRQPGQANQTNHIQLLSQFGEINITGDAGTTIGGGIGHSSWGNVYIGSPANASFTATGNVKLMYSKFVGAGLNGMLVKTTGHVTYEPTSTSFTATENFPHNSNYVLADGAASLTIGKPDNTADITIASAQSVAGNLTIYGGILTLNGNLTTTNGGNISLYSNNALAGITAGRSISAAGTFTYAPQGNSFAASVTYPIANLSLSSTGLLLGKPTNTAALTFNATTINGPVTAYGGAITVSGALSAAGNILLDADTGGFLSQNTKGVFVNASITSTNNGNITILGRGGSGTAQSENHGIHIVQTIQAGGTGTLSLTGFGGLSANTNNGSNHGVYMNGGNAWVKTNAGNLTISGNGGGVNSGSYSQGIAMENGAKVSTGGSGQITMTGTGGVNTAAGMRGMVLVSGSSVFSAGGAIELNCIAGSNGTDNSDGLTLDAATIGSNSSGPITITATAGSGANSEAISLASGSTIGAVGYANNITLKANNFAFSAPAANINTSGQFTLEPTSNSFSAPLSFPITNLTVANTITGLTIGKSTNTAALTLAATSVNGPITLYGGALTLNGALTTTSSNSTPSNISLNGTTVSNAALNLAQGSTLTMNLSSNTTYSGLITGTNLSFVKNGAGTLSLTGATALSFIDFTISGGTFRLNSNQQLTLSGSLTNNGTFTMRSGATFVPSATVSNITGTGTYNVQRFLTDNAATWSTANTSRFWYMGVPVNNAPRSSFGTYNETANRLFSYNEYTKAYTNITDNAALLTRGTGYVHRRSTNDTLTFTGTSTNGLLGGAYSQTNMTRTSGSSVGFHLVSNPYMAYVDWNTVVANTNTATSNIESTYYIRSAATGNISALISYNATGQTYVNGGLTNITSVNDVRYLAPMQAFWVRVGSAATTGSIGMNTGMLSHQTSNPGLKNTTVFPTLARVNLVDGPRFDQLLVFMNQDLSNTVDAYDSEKMFVSGTPQIYTMAAGKKLVMNGLNSNKKKISVPLYLELPESKVYNLQLAEYILEDGIILLEDKQEGTIQDFTIHDTYAFYANSGVLSNRFVLHFFMPDATITAQGPSNSWVEDETSYTEGGSVQITADAKGKVQISLDQPETDKVEGTVQATDANGRVVYSGALEGLTTEFQLNVPSGIYYLTVQSGNMMEKKKVFIQD